MISNPFHEAGIRVRVRSYGAVREGVTIDAIGVAKHYNNDGYAGRACIRFDGHNYGSNPFNCHAYSLEKVERAEYEYVPSQEGDKAEDI